MKKKITLLAIVFSIMMTSLFAEEAEEDEKEWANFCGMGIMFSVYNMKTDGDGNRNFTGALIDLSETVVNIDNGLTFRADWGIWGETVCDDVSAFGDGNKKFHTMDFAVGVGYSFIRNEKTSLSLCGTLGFNWISKTADADFIFGEKKFSELEYSLFMFGVGANLGFQKKISSRFGFFANVGCRYQILGTEKIEYSDDEKMMTAVSFSRDAFGKFAITPALGINIEF